MCTFCYNNKKKEGRTIFAVECDGCAIVVRNVPCIVCEHCGAESFNYDVSKRLSDIVKEAKKMKKDLFVVDYNSYEIAA